ncbi:MAG: U32 family peptidase [Eubacteriales bacterium]
MMKIPELLAPAGSPEALEAAIRAGADAVYLGSTLFNARMSAKNFTRPAIADAVKTAHEAGVRVYVTLNTTVLDRGMREAMELADFLYHTGVDALIVSDLGLASEIHRIFPDFPLHGSTQCSGHNADAAKFLQKQGFSLMVCARECRKEDIRKLIQNSPIPIEVFVHGALCVSASGQCLMSSFIGGRSGNRGECAQPCRMPYQGGYPLSLKDNCLAGHITELIDMGVASLKIEGRMKSPEYVGGVTAVYRRLLDERRNATDGEIARLAALFSRDGFTDGYFTGRHEQMNGIRREEDKAASVRTSGGIPVSKDFRREPIVLPMRPNRLPENYRPTAEKLPISQKSASARFYQAKSVPEHHSFDIVYLPLDRFDGRVANGVLLPPTVYESEKESVRAKLIAAKKAGAVHALIPNIGEIEMAKELGFVLHGDFRLNITNSFSARLYGEIFEDFLLSPELTAPQCRDISGNKGVIVYGRVPLMLLEKSPCVQKLVDRRKVVFPILREGGRDLIFNSVPIYMADKRDVLRSMGDYHSHMIFTTEGVQEVRYILENYKKGLPTKKEIRRIQ